MRCRVGNPFNDQHYLLRQWYMRTYDFIAVPTDPHSVAQAIEYVVPDLCVFGRGTILKERIWVENHFEDRIVRMQDFDLNKQDWVNGAVWTSWSHDFIRDEPCLYVAIGLYDIRCYEQNCLAGHKNYKIQIAPQLEQWQLDAIKEEIGEHSRLRLGLDKFNDKLVLNELGFTYKDAPCQLL